MSEVHSMLGINNRRINNTNNGSGMGYSTRPSPYDRGDRCGSINRFQARGSRSFKGAVFNNNMSGNSFEKLTFLIIVLCFSVSINSFSLNFTDRKFSDFNNFDRPNSWSSNSNHNGDMEGNHSPWGGNSSDRGNNGIHCVHMRGLPFKATQMDIADVNSINLEVRRYNSLY